MASYLELLHWTLRTSADKRWLVCQPGAGSEYSSLELTLPQSADSVEMRAYLAGAINILSDITNEAPEKVVQRVQLRDRDVLRLRMLETEGSDSIELHRAAQNVKNLEKLVASTAANEKRPRPYYKNVPTISKKAVQQFRFGHTFPGSFGFVVESGRVKPRPKMRQQTLFGEEEYRPRPPFQRRVVERIIRGISTLVGSESTDPGLIVADYASGLNANMCEAVAAIASVHPAEIEVMWSPVISPTEDVVSVHPLRVSSRHVGVLREAAQELKRIEPRRIEVTGQVVGLTSEDPLAINARHVVIVKTVLPESDRNVRVELDLGPTEYMKALEVHKYQGFVRIVGTLIRAGMTYRMTDLSLFEDWIPRGGAE